MTLMEVLAVCVIGGILSAAAYRIASETWGVTTRAVRRAHAQQEIEFVARTWRRFVHGSEPASWRAAASRFATSDGTALCRNGFLVVQTAGSAAASVRLPVNARAEFNVERPAGQAPMAVLILHLRPARHEQARTLRIVACNPVESDGERHGD